MMKLVGFCNYIFKVLPAVLTQWTSNVFYKYISCALIPKMKRFITESSKVKLIFSALKLSLSLSY
jgi:hypothetical protein